MRSFVVFGLVASSVFAAPVKRSLTAPIANLPVVGDVVKTAGGALTPVTGGVVAPVVAEVEKLPLVGDTAGSVVNSAVGLLSNVRREPEPALTEPLTNLPVVGDVVKEAGSVTAPIVGGVVAPVVSTVEKLPLVGDTLGSVVNGVVGIASNVRREPEPALTAPLTDLPVVGDLVKTAGGALTPVTGGVVAPVVSTVGKVPVVGPVAENVVTGAVGVLSNVRREPEPQLDAVTGVVNTVTGVTNNLPVVGGVASEVVGAVEGVVNVPINAANGVTGQGLALPL